MPARFATLDRTGKLNGTTKQQQFFGKRRLARIRVRDNCKRPALADLFRNIRHVVANTDALTVGSQLLDEYIGVFTAIMRLIVRRTLRHFVEALFLVQRQRIGIRRSHLEKNLAH